MKRHTKLIAIILLISTGISLVPLHFAHADVGDVFGDAVESVGKSIDEFVYNSVNFLYELVGNSLSFGASLLEGVINYSIQPNVVSPDMIKNAWGTFRDFTNMFFILVLIIMAFGTIFDIDHYTFKDMFPKFLIAALLINFSFVIGVYILQIGNGISFVFLQSIKGVAGQLGKALEIQKLISPNFGTYPGGSLTQLAPVIITMLGLLTMMLIILGTFLAAAIFIIIRIVVIWLLLIVSPFAWFGYTLPSLKKSTWSAWWSAFISWSFFLPVYLFFVMFAIYFLNSRGTVGTQIDASQSHISSTGEVAKFLSGIFGAPDLLFFALGIAILLGGIWAAFKVGNLAGSGVGAVMNFAQGRVKALPVFRVGGLRNGRWSSWSDFEGGAKKLSKEFEEKGVPPNLGFGAGKLLKPIWGGKEAYRRGEEFVGNQMLQTFGYRTKGIEGPKEEQKQVDDAVHHMEDDIASGKTTAAAIAADLHTNKIVDALGNLDAHTVAGFKIAAQKGLLDQEHFEELMKKLANKNPSLAKNIASDYFKNKLKNFNAQEILQIVAPVAGSVFASKQMAAVRKEMSQLLITDDGKGRVKKFGDDADEHRAFMSQVSADYGGDQSAEFKAFTKAIAKIRPDIVINYNNTAIGADRQKLYKDYWPSTNKDVVELAVRTWKDNDFQEVLLNRLKAMDAAALDKYREMMSNQMAEFGEDDTGEKQTELNEIIRKARAIAVARTPAGAATPGGATPAAGGGTP